MAIDKLRVFPENLNLRVKRPMGDLNERCGDEESLLWPLWLVVAYPNPEGSFATTKVFLKQMDLLLLFTDSYFTSGLEEHERLISQIILFFYECSVCRYVCAAHVPGGCQKRGFQSPGSVSHPVGARN